MLLFIEKTKLIVYIEIFLSINPQAKYMIHCVLCKRIANLFWNGNLYTYIFVCFVYQIIWLKKPHSILHFLQKHLTLKVHNGLACLGIGLHYLISLLAVNSIWWKVSIISAHLIYLMRIMVRNDLRFCLESCFILWWKANISIHFIYIYIYIY